MASKDDSKSNPKAPAPKLATATEPKNFLPVTHTYRVWLTGDNEQDNFIVGTNAVNSSLSVQQIAVDEYVRRNGVAPVSFDKQLQLT